MQNSSEPLPTIPLVVGTAGGGIIGLIGLFLQVIFAIVYVLRKLKKVTVNKDGVNIERVDSPTDKK